MIGVLTVALVVVSALWFYESQIRKEQHEELLELHKRLRTERDYRYALLEKAVFVNGGKKHTERRAKEGQVSQ